VPIFEFTCRACLHEFETLVRSSEAATCVRCSSAELDKKLSVFATQKPVGDSAPTACGTCGHPGGPGSCAIN
jgi:putative FmdB family regulatory protein